MAFGSEKIPDEFIEYVKFIRGVYYVKKRFENKMTTFGKFDSVKEACAATSILLKNRWMVYEVSKNPLAAYEGEFWVFKVKDEKLVLDKKFLDFELAVEYVEINVRCNDYHNDIFRKSLKKKRHDERFKFSNQEMAVTNDKYVFEDESGRFIVQKSKNTVPFGRFNSFDVAVAARKLLSDLNWNITDGNEVFFFDDVYWVFNIDYNFLTFKGKSDSYEDAMDIINLPEHQGNDFTNPYIKEVEKNFDEVMTNRKSKKPKRSSHRSKSTSNKFKRNIGGKLKYDWKVVRDNLKLKSSVDITKIWNPKIQTYNFKNKHFRIYVESSDGNVVDLFSILDFNFFSDKHIQCIVDGNEIKWDNRYDVEIPNFPEFQLIINILEINGWDLSKIRNSSSIYFYNEAYYKIQVVDNEFIFGKFISYEVAENTSLIHNRRPVLSIDYNSLAIDKFKDSYVFVSFKNGEVFKTENLKSLEVIKAIRDILMHANWNSYIFDKYNLFYLNGFYWELSLKNNVIYFIDKYELIKTI